jgi:hypothetical protein
MVLVTRVIKKIIFLTAMEYKLILMEKYSKESFLMELNKGLEYTLIAKTINIKDNLRITKCTEKVFILGKMEIPMKGNFRIIILMEMEHTL